MADNQRAHPQQGAGPERHRRQATGSTCTLDRPDLGDEIESIDTIQFEGHISRTIWHRINGFKFGSVEVECCGPWYCREKHCWDGAEHGHLCPTCGADGSPNRPPPPPLPPPAPHDEVVRRLRGLVRYLRESPKQEPADRLRWVARKVAWMLLIGELRDMGQRSVRSATTPKQPGFPAPRRRRSSRPNARRRGGDGGHEHSPRRRGPGPALRRRTTPACRGGRRRPGCSYLAARRPDGRPRRDLGAAPAHRGPTHRRPRPVLPRQVPHRRQRDRGRQDLARASACLDEMQAGHHVVYLDFEDDEGGIVGRLLTLGVDRDASATSSTTSGPRARSAPASTATTSTALLVEHAPTLAILDGITEAMTLHGLNPLDNARRRHVQQAAAPAIAATGAAVASLDHVTKAREGRGRYAIGAAHKFNGLDGAQYLLENRTPFGVGITGRPRSGSPRTGSASSAPTPCPADGLHWYGDLVLHSHAEGFAEVSVDPPHERDEDSDPRSTCSGSRRVGRSPHHCRSGSGPRLSNGEARIRDALNRLILDGYVSPKSPHQLLQPYPDQA